jgi:hypothetical protein
VTWTLSLDFNKTFLSVACDSLLGMMLASLLFQFDEIVTSETSSQA